MVVKDEEKTAFVTPIGCYYYTCMPFGIKNAGVFVKRLTKPLAMPKVVAGAPATTT
jgi:hypothetical protein